RVEQIGPTRLAAERPYEPISRLVSREPDRAVPSCNELTHQATAKDAGRTRHEHAHSRGMCLKRLNIAGLMGTQERRHGEDPGRFRPHGRTAAHAEDRA